MPEAAKGKDKPDRTTKYRVEMRYILATLYAEDFHETPAGARWNALYGEEDADRYSFRQAHRVAEIISQIIGDKGVSVHVVPIPKVTP